MANVLAVVALAYFSQAEGKSLLFNWSDCGNASTHGHVMSLTSSPNPAPLGKPAKITSKIKLDNNLTSASYEGSVGILGLTVVDHKDSLCGDSQFDISVLFVGKVGSITVHGPPCPVPAGEFDLGIDLVLEDAPGGVPSGGVATVSVTAKDQSGSDVMCLRLDAKIVDTEAIKEVAIEEQSGTCANPGDCGLAYQACCAGFAAKGFPCGCHLKDGDGKAGGSCGTCGTAYSVCCAGFKAKGIPCTCDIAPASQASLVV